MSDDLDDLRARVVAARDRLASDVDLAQKVELRLNDLARIVEGSLARQSAELDVAKQQIGLLEEDLGRALARAEQASGEASRAEQLTKENGELKIMVMTLLDVIEGRQKSSLISVMQKLEENVSAFVAGSAIDPAAHASEPEREINARRSISYPLATEMAPLEDLSEIALYDAANEVVEPERK